MTDAKKNLWDVIIAWVGMLVTAVTILIGVFVGLYQFERGETNKVKLESELLRQKDDIAFRRQLWLERLATYRKVAEAAGTVVANANDSKKMEDNVVQFTSLYWGAMIFVEDTDVQSSMIDFALAVKDYKGDWISLDELKIKADFLIEACRKSAEKTP